jgi:anti-sigma regulatory factor (Ser/Thr protein kinase)
MMHGDAPRDASITVVLEPPTEVGLLAVIEDTARPFDPTTVPPRVAPKTIEEASVGKLGVHLVRNYAAQIEYERRGDRNRLTLRFTNTMGGSG